MPPAPAYDAWLRQHTVERARVYCMLAIVLVPLFGLLDLYTAPSVAGALLWLRVGVSAACALLLAVSYRAAGLRHPLALSAAVPLVVGIGIEGMIVLLGAHESPYYAGLCLVILTAGVLFPWTAAQMAGFSLVVLAVYWLPPLFEPRAIDWKIFVNNNYFLFATGVITTTSSYYSARLRRSDFDARAELRGSVDKLREVDQLKNQFFANISHELRTPLTLILAPAEDLLGRASDDHTAAQLRVIRSNAGRLLALIDELLDLSRLDAGGLRLTLGDVDLSALAATLVDNARPAAAARSIDLEAQPQPQPMTVVADAHRIEIVLTNLVGNALKFTPPGGRISVAVADEPDAVCVRVTDTGPGIAEHELPHVFERFYQADRGERRRNQGMTGAGIGLALARELAELHGGSLGVTSRLGDGATFTLRLRRGRDHFRPEVIERRRRFDPTAEPRRRAEDLGRVATAGPPAPAPPGRRSASSHARSSEPMPMVAGRRPRLLIVEDRDELRHFIARLFADSCEVLEAADGQQAFELARRERPDVVVSDVMMPRRSGTALCADIKRDPQLHATPVILLTARVGSEATLEAYAHGANDFVPKPFHPRVLIARVRAQLRLRELTFQLADREKLAAVGILAAGVAHEVRNPINAIHAAATVLTERAAPAPTPERRLLDVIADGVERILGIVSALEAHARPAEHGETERCDLRAGLEATLRLLEHRSADVEIHRDYACERQARVSAGPINQVFLNLIDNALRSGARRLWVGLHDAGDHLRVRIADDGPGVPDDARERVFDPFFTTREPGEGTGLGLYLSRKLVEDSGGTIELRDRDGGGAELVLELPAAPPA